MGSRYTKYDLERVTDYLEFGSFCHTLISRVGYDNIEPLGGFSDKGRDAIHVSRSSGEITIFVYSVREDWNGKLNKDLGKIRKHGHKCNRVVFVTTANLTAGEKDHSKDSVHKDYGWELEIYDLERIATLVEGPHQDLIRTHPGIFPLSLGDALNESGDVQNRLGLHPSSPRIFISYARHDGQEFANSLRRRLEKEGFGIWQDIASMEGGRDWWEQISKAIKQVEYLVMVMTPGALETKYTAMEWKRSRQEGTCVLPVFGGEEIDLSKLPRWLRDKHFVDTTIPEQWTRFIRTLEGPCQTERVPFMADDLPDDFVSRSDELEEAIANLLKEDRAKPVGITALYGGGGFGKTTLAREICHDERIEDAFDDGVLWVTLGETPGNPTAQLEDLIYVLSGERPGYTTMDAAAARLRELLEGRDILIVIDDVWDSSHLRPFLQGGSRCARLITTRNSDTLPAGSSNLKLESMTPREAVKLLAAGLDAEQVRALNAEFGRLAARLGEWPLLLKLVNAALRKRTEGYKQPVLDALNDANEALTRRGLTAFDKKNSQQRSDAVAKTIGLSIALLEGSERERYQELAIFPEDVDVPLAAVEKLWGATAGLEPFESKELCERLADLSLLLKFDLAGSYIRLHDVFRQYLIGLQGDRLPALHAVFLDAHRPAVNNVQTTAVVNLGSPMHCVCTTWVTYLDWVTNRH